jgi:arsenate reductase
VTARERRYLDEPPTVAELEELASMLGSDDGAELLRAKEPEYAELGLADADRATRLAAIAAHPRLFNRPVLVYAGRAVVARPVERAFEIL